VTLRHAANGAPARLFFLPPAHWLLILGAAAVAAAVTADAYARDSAWIGVGVALAVAVAMHTVLVSRVIPWFPGLAVLVALLQWVLAPWAAYHMPPLTPAFAMVVPPTRYFAYAVPCAVALAIGVYAPLWRLGRGVAARRVVDAPADFRVTCDAMIAVGLIARLVATQEIPWSMTYALALLSDLAWVGAFGLLLRRSRGWGWRLAIVFLVRAALASSDAMFHDLLLWAAAAMVLAAFAQRLRPVTVSVIAAAGIVLLGAVNEVKSSYRGMLVADPGRSVADRTAALGQAFVAQIAHPTQPFTGTAWVRTVTRANQGWIIAHVLTWVPVREPYAEGETLVTALGSALQPRVVDPHKYVAGGRTYFERFTGLPLSRVTSMNLSVAGEMYANFGAEGGVVGVLLIGLVVGWLVRGLTSLARRSLLWWAWAPYLLLYAMQAENGIGEEVNQIVKALITTCVVIAVVPAWRTLRWWPLRHAQLRPVRS